MSIIEQNSRIEEANYFNDSRTGKPKGITVYIERVIDGEEGWQEERELPWKWDVCPVCDGKGSHVNPSIDCGGLTGEDFAEDPDFAEDYFSGVYDQTCNECHGRTTVAVVDEARCSEEELEALEADLRAEHEIRAEHLAEIRAGC